jgi:ABC-2 type transport system permease protein
MNLTKIWLIAMQEFWANLKRPSFLFAVFGTPILVMVSIGLGVWAGSSEDDLGNYTPVGVLDRTEQALFSNQVQPKDFPDQFVWVTDEASAQQAVMSGELAAYIDFSPEYIVSGEATLYGLRGAPDDFFDAADALVLANLIASVDLPLPAERIENGVDLTVNVLDGGRTFDSESVFFITFLPLLFGFFLVMASMTTSSFLMQTLSEEKTNRIMEILITTVRPMELLSGKVLGMGLLGLLQVVVFLAAGVIGLSIAQGQNQLLGLSIPPDMMVLALVYYVLSYFLLAAGLSGIGVITGSEMESRQLSAVVIIPVMLPYMAIVTFLIDPNGTLPTIFSLIPFTSPMAVMMRVGLTTVPAWQIAVSIIGLVLTDLLILWVSARLFRWGILSHGKTPGLRALWKIIRGRGDTIGQAPSSAVKEVVS